MRYACESGTIMALYAVGCDTGEFRGAVTSVSHAVCGKVMQNAAFRSLAAVI